MKTRIVTCSWGARYVALTQRFAQTFDRFWPAEVECVIYADRDMILPPRIIRRPLDDIPGLAEFWARWRPVPEANGLGSQKKWTHKERAAGYAWKRDACKWVAQALTPAAAARDMQDGDILAWFDADVLTTSPVPGNWVETLLHRQDISFLGRDIVSEIGFIGFRLPQARPIIEEFAAIYLDGRFMDAGESHSAHVFDIARKMHPESKAHDLAPGQRGHVWPASPLGAFCRHDKGQRKPR